MVLKLPTSGGGGEREVAESSGKMSVDDPLLCFQYWEASFGSIPLLSPESIPESSPDSRADDMEWKPLPEVGVAVVTVRDGLRPDVVVAATDTT